MKRVISSIFAVSMLFLASCGKKRLTVPEPDTETSTAVDAAQATFVVSDVETQCSFMAENLCWNILYRSSRFRCWFARNYDYNTRHQLEGILTWPSINALYWWPLRDGTIFMNYGGYPGFVNPRYQTDSEYSHSYGLMVSVPFQNTGGMVGKMNWPILLIL